MQKRGIEQKCVPHFLATAVEAAALLLRLALHKQKRRLLCTLFSGSYNTSIILTYSVLVKTSQL